MARRLHRFRAGAARAVSWQLPPPTDEATMSTPIDSRFGLSVRHARSHPTSAHIFLQRIVRHSNGMLAVTPVCSSLAEMEEHIEQMKDELDQVLRQARQAFLQNRTLPVGS